MASSIEMLAEQEKIDIPKSLIDRYNDTTGLWNKAARCWHGILGKSDNLVEVICKTPTEILWKAGNLFIPADDFKDLKKELFKSINGEDIDELKLGLSACGMALYWANLFSGGATNAARLPLSVVKDFAVAERLSRPFKEKLREIVSHAVDVKKLTSALKKVNWQEVNKVYRVIEEIIKEDIKPDKLGPLRPLAYDIVQLSYVDNSVPTITQAMSVANDPEELHRIVRLSEKRGGATAAVLRLLGRGAVVPLGKTALIAWFIFSIAYVTVCFTFIIKVSVHHKARFAQIVFHIYYQIRRLATTVFTNTAEYAGRIYSKNEGKSRHQQ